MGAALRAVRGCKLNLANMMCAVSRLPYGSSGSSKQFAGWWSPKTLVGTSGRVLQVEASTAAFHCHTRLKRLSPWALVWHPSVPSHSRPCIVVWKKQPKNHLPLGHTLFKLTHKLDLNINLK